MDEAEGATPLDPDEAEGLIPTHITTLEELNEWEQANILRGERWAGAPRRQDILSSAFVVELHNRMFGDTWTWAGRFRTTDKNIGIHWPQIPVAVHDLCEDAKHWIENGVFDIDEAAARFHYGLAHVHPFPNGNGRHARLITDVLLVSHGRPRFTWGSGDLRRAGSVRRAYIAALRAADAQEFEPLLEFLRANERA